MHKRLNMKNIRYILLNILLLGMLFSCTEESEDIVIPVDGITLNSNSLTITVGDTEELVADISPIDANDKSVEWTSSDSDIAKVINGYIIAVHKGEATITVKANNDISTECKVLVLNTDVSIKKDRLYKTVKIDNQIWMAENYDYLNDKILSTGALVYDYTGNDVKEAKENENYIDYGVLYNWDTAMAMCPDGWHLPTDEEWKTLELYLGMTQTQVDMVGPLSGSVFRGDKDMIDKIINISWGGTNETGLSLSPGGARDSKGFFHLYRSGNFWTSTKENEKAWIRGLAPILIHAINRSKLPVETYLSVRYIKN